MKRNEERLCTAQTRAGRRCQVYALRGSDLCNFHSLTPEERRQRQGRGIAISAVRRRKPKTERRVLDIEPVAVPEPEPEPEPLRMGSPAKFLLSDVELRRLRTLARSHPSRVYTVNRYE
jgi:hypothetical protein